MSPEQAFGEIIRSLRKRQAMSQESLAFLSGLDRSFVSHIERGAKSSTLSTIFKVASALDISVSEIMLQVEEKLKATKI